MAKFVLFRVVAVVPLLAAVSVISFGLVVLLELGGNVAQEVLGEGAADPEAVAALEAELGLDRPPPARFAGWLAGAVRGDFGSSLLRPGVPVTTLIGERVWPTASIAGFGLLVGGAAGAALGTAAGARPGRLGDRLASLTAGVMMAVPPFVAAMGLVVVFSVWAGWFEPTGYRWPGDDGWAAWLASITLPGVAVAFPVAAVVQRQLRGSMSAVLASRYVLAARARGAGPGRVVACHVLRNAAPPAVTVMGFQAAAAVGATVAVEQVFAVPGLGTLLLQSVVQRDVTVVQGTLMVIAPFVAGVNLLVDVCHGWLNPRVRLS